MPFETLDARLKAIAEKALAFCKSRFGGNGLKIDEVIAPEIGWRPSFFMRPTRVMILAVEVDDFLFPEALRGSAYELHKFNHPIAIFQACSLAAYQSDPKQTRVNLLRKNGFGILTVDDGTAVIQHNCVPLAQHISVEELDAALSDLTPKLKVYFRGAHDVYVGNVGQGVQQVGQIVEALIGCIAKQAADKSVISAAEAKGNLADVIDTLYTKSTFRDHRAALGAARDFIKEYRNIASHPQRTAAEAMTKIQKCRAGFLRGISVTSKLRTAMQQLGYQIAIHIT
jgi:hypothetical protein